jgi:hypothetical protein
MAIIETIETVYLEADAANITFSSLGSYKDLQVVMSAHSTYSGSGYHDIYIEFNGSSGSDYASHAFYVYNDTSVSLNKYTGLSSINAGGLTAGPLSDASLYAPTTVNIYDYLSTNKNTALNSMTGIEDDYQGNSKVQFAGAVWNSTAALTSIKLTPSSASFLRGTTMSLYGIKSS